MFYLGYLSKISCFVELNFVVVPGVDVMPAYFRDTNRQTQYSNELATVTILVNATELSDYCLKACAKGFKPWDWEFRQWIDKKIESDVYPVTEDMAERFEQVARQRLIDAIESGARDWALANVND
jgi:hypothetical protein